MANLLYNGVSLPDVRSFWDPENTYYTKVAVLKHISEETYRAIKASNYKEKQIHTLGNGTTFCTGSIVLYDLTDGAWVTNKAYPSGVSITDYLPIWANFNIYTEGYESIYLGPSDPIDPAAPVTGITLNQPAVTLNRGESFQFEATVTGSGYFDPAVTYTVSGNDPNGGTTLNSEGTLKIGANEYAARITVTAASVHDPSVSVTATVTVADHISKLTVGTQSEAALTWNASDGYLATAPFGDDMTFCKLFDDVLTYDTLLPGTIFVKAGSIEVDVPMAEEGVLVEEDGLLIVGEMLVVVPEEAAPAMGLPSGGTWAMGDMAAFGYEFLSLTYPVSNVADTTATVNFTCKNLLSAEQVYRIQAWCYPKGMDYWTAPATWESEPFPGPAYSESVTFPNLFPGTEYEVYAVICGPDGPTEHSATAAFITQGTPVNTVQASVFCNQVTESGFTVWLIAKGLDSSTQYTAEFAVFREDTSGVLEEVVTFTGDEGIQYCAFKGLRPNTAYVAAVNLYPTGGESVFYGECAVTTAASEKDDSIFAGADNDFAARARAFAGTGTAQAVSVWLGVDGAAQPL